MNPNEVNNLDQSQTVPASLEEAMLVMRKSNDENSTNNVGNEQLDVNAGTGESEQFAEANATDDQSGQNANSTDADTGMSGAQEVIQGEADDGSLGGYPASEQTTTEESVNYDDDYDYEALGKSYIKSVQQMAIQSANETFRSNGIKKISINDLYEKDDNGRVSFKNPDNPGSYFSSRAEAQQWVDAINNQIDSEWRNTVRQYQNQYAKDIQPTMRLIQFASEFNSMTKQQQDIFDEVIDPYTIRNNAGEIIGYSCDLNEAKRIAMNIAAKTGVSNINNTDANISEIPQQGTGPATDATTSGSDNSQNQEPKEPKDIAEAYKMVVEQEKAARAAKKK